MHVNFASLVHIKMKKENLHVNYVSLANIKMNMDKMYVNLVQLDLINWNKDRNNAKYALWVSIIIFYIID